MFSFEYIILKSLAKSKFEIYSNFMTLFYNNNLK